MMQALMDGADIHKRNASIAFDIPYDEVDPAHRQLAKAVTFGVLYGEGPQGLADSRGLSLDEAKETINRVMKAMPGIDRTSQVVQEFAKQRGYVETISGHVRRLPEAQDAHNPAKQSRAIRQSFNAVIQGSGSYCTNTALYLIRKAIKKFNLKSRIVITVHDSIVLDVHPSEMMIIPKLAKKIMEHLPIPELICKRSDYPDLKVADKYAINDKLFRFPLFAEGEFGKTYGDALDLDMDELAQLGAETYYQYGMECKLVNDTYNTQLKDEQDDDKKADIVKTRDTKLGEIHKKYFGE